MSVSLLVCLSSLAHLISLFLLNDNDSDQWFVPPVPERMDLGLFVVWHKARSVQRSRCTSSERVPLEMKWDCTCAGDRDVFTCVKNVWLECGVVW